MFIKHDVMISCRVSCDEKRLLNKHDIFVI